jgi:hypothetical protein
VSGITTIVTINGKGQYSYNPTGVTVSQSNTTLTYTLDTATALEWEIVGLTNTDSKNQLSNESKAVGGNSISILDANSQSEIFDITVVAQSRAQRERLVRVDPQVTNIPPK